MSDEKDIANIKVAAGKRTYFIGVKQTREEVKYLKISENKRLDSGEYERHQIIVFEENIHTVVEAIRSALQHFPSYQKPEIKSKMEQSKEKYANAYQPWNEEDDLNLTEMFCKGKKIKELAEFFQRNAGAINSRIKKLELKEKYRS